jgi:hypothetical protein
VGLGGLGRSGYKSTAAFEQYLIDRETAANAGTPILILEIQGIPKDLGIRDVVLNLKDGSTCPTGLQ